ncbi:unnamed protein product [Lactuca saligna]|uniref:Uncharacterized protein n=1 Tax=Lactuca saligna TaxID=75948 RepID=A0AA35YHD3_LACSI|nr:unnamed protein product [Lactuca saligna]
MCLVIYQAIPSSMFLLLFFEPLSIAFETLQGILVHGFQLVGIWAHHSRGKTTDSKLLTFMDTSAAPGSQLEWGWKLVIFQHVCFFLDIMTLLMAFGHYVQIWRLNGMPFLMLLLFLVHCIIVGP